MTEPQPNRMQDLQLRQRGRAELAFAGSLTQADNRLNRAIDQRLRTTFSDQEIAADYDARLAQLDAHLENDLPHAMATITGDWLSRNHGEICRTAFEELGSSFTGQLDALDEGPTTLEVKPGFSSPHYYSKQWFHNTTGGWEGHPYMGAIQAEFVHRRYVAAKYGAGLRQLRYELLARLPQETFHNILELGTSAGYFTEQLARRFPEAQLTGCDLSLRMLEQARRLGNEQGHAWRLWQAAAEDTGFANDTFDLVISYAMFHEIPGEIAAAVWREAHRVVRPGGWVLIADGVPHLDAVDKVTGWRFLSGWLRGGEPYARDYCTNDDSKLARAAGFATVHEGLLTDRPFPR